MDSILHINCNLNFTKLFYNIFRYLSDFEVNQTVWVPHKKYHKIDIAERIEKVEYFSTGYQDIFDKVLFHRKIRKGIDKYDSMKNSLLGSVIHAHTLFSDGALAYEINRKKGTPYIVTVRSTDVNTFWKYFPHLHNYGRRIAQRASSIIFLGKNYRDTMIKRLFPENHNDILPKVHVIPNGLDPFWSSHPPSCQKISGAEIRVLFVGSFIKRKNIKTLVNACSILRNNGENIILRLVGAKRCEDFLYSKTNAWIETLPFCKSKQDLSKHYRWADVFVMPSFNETFGLVYAEALSQGTPVIFTKGQGFDGWIKEGPCGYAVHPKNSLEISNHIKLLHHKSSQYECIKSSHTFNWKIIVEKYMGLYGNAFLQR
jgi:glycosyltransferase involved in cell wall biosynthesis